MKRILLPILRLLDRFAQRVVPVKGDRVFYASMPDYADSAHAVYRHLLATRRDLEHVWLVRDLALADRIRREFAGYADRGHRLLIRAWSPRSYLSFIRSRWVFHTHGVFGFSEPARGRTTVCLWHGMPVKAIRRLHDGDFEMFPVFGTLHVATSSFFRYIIAGVFDVHPASVLVSGLPRVDVLKGKAEPGHDREAIARQLGLDADRPWVLWMPTHRSEPNPSRAGASRSFLEAVDPPLVDALDDAATEVGAQVIVKLHPFDLLNDGEVQIDQASIRLLTSAQWESTGIQLYDLVAASDALITDISSVFIDYLHTGNPIGIMGFDGERYTRDTLFDHGLLLRCGAARALKTPGDARAFMAGLRVRGGETSGTTDLSVVFNEDQDIASAESIAEAAGL